jgi:adenine-specific DNA methylase
LTSDESLRDALLEFVAVFSDWDRSTDPKFLEVARTLVESAHVAMGGARGSKPLVVDSFAGRGSIPLEALRVGADAYAVDYSPVAALILKATLELGPRMAGELARDLEIWGAKVREEVQKEIGRFYPPDPDGSVPVAYLWARTMRCEGPDCGVEYPLVHQLQLVRRDGLVRALRLVSRPSAKQVDVEVVDVAVEDIGSGTVSGGKATCPVCGFTMARARLHAQPQSRRGGAANARLLAVIVAKPGRQGRQYRSPTERDLKNAHEAAEELARRQAAHAGPLSLVPDEPLNPILPRPSSGANGVALPTRIGCKTFGDLFTPRQALALTSFVEAVKKAPTPELRTFLAIAVDRLADRLVALARWNLARETVEGAYSRQALAIVWDFVEGNPFSGATGDWDGAINWIRKVLEHLAASKLAPGHVHYGTATAIPLPDAAAQAVVTDPPYYHAIPYSDIGDYFYVWLRRSLGDVYPDLFGETLAPKPEEIIVTNSAKGLRGQTKDGAFFESEMRRALVEARRILAPDGIGLFVFAQKTTAGWEAMLQAMVDAGWVITATWPIESEMSERTNARGAASLLSSINIVCRPRSEKRVGEWQQVLAELPRRVAAWMKRLGEEGVVGADAIFSCIGPAIEIFSRYERVERASGVEVTLREYLEQTWAAVSREALRMVFEGAETEGLEADARLTAMWLWTLEGRSSAVGSAGDDEAESRSADSGDDEESNTPQSPSAGFVIEFDAARKIAQGLGARLDELGDVVEVKGDKARLLPVAERGKYLFGRGESPAGKKPTKKKQMALFAEVEEAAAAQGWGSAGAPKAGTSTLDRVHQAMLLFGSGRGEVLKRFLVDDAVGKAGQFWTLAQALSALYPSGSNERRWVDGILARKKGLGFG